MKKQDTTAKASTLAEHLRRDGKRRANRAERRRVRRRIGPMEQEQEQEPMVSEEGDTD